MTNKARCKFIKYGTYANQYPVTEFHSQSLEVAGKIYYLVDPMTGAIHCIFTSTVKPAQTTTFIRRPLI